ncbi:hypothetical protein FISHEDRAFT_63695 [Fistulina hepatica ATCC 64428]|uniref:Uncharacterized protein n=1 Tax=Fistulina hepatica ATCC 64428 TaxID=1128425 RepID=A0A0D7ALX8_9AGAR|nr:hypothetical protein FISHEDRAFT_63695 [Fistulina hepatica ATCC 64428]
MSSAKFATDFAPYRPPPDEPEYHTASTSTVSRSGAWFSRPASHLDADTSYQSGGIPTFGTSASGALGSETQEEDAQNIWETQYGWRVDVLAGVAYLFGPISALLLLILETKNDFVRFHAYQSALVSAPLVVVRVLASILQFPYFLRTTFTLAILLFQVFMAFRAYSDANSSYLIHYQLPFIGPVAEQWLMGE